MSARGAIGLLVLAGCAASEPEPASRVRAIAAPCTVDVQGVGGLGYGWLGLRGDGSAWTGSPATKELALGNDAIAIADVDGESLHHCAIRSDGSLWCWGQNLRGQCGTGVASGEIPDPTEVTALGAGLVEAVVSWDFSCARKLDGTVWCWGGNSFGQLGDGSTIDRLVPTELTTLGAGVDQISAGYDHACALRDGDLYCWGGNLYGQIGAGDFTPPAPPHPLPELVLGGVRKVSAGGFFTCAILEADDSLWCWGANASGHLGLGTGDTSNRNVPALVAGVGPVQDVDTGVRSACALRTDGAIWCWGFQGGGRLGDGVDAMTQREQPMPISGPLGVGGGASIRVAEGAGCALDAAGALWCWGWGSFLDGQPASSVPIAIDLCSLPTIDFITPTAGSTLGGTIVSIHGDAFDPLATVSFHTTPADAVNVVSDTLIQATAPMYWVDTVDVVVVNPGDRRAVLPDAFSFRQPPAIYQVVPYRGPTAGGTSVSVLGSGLHADVQVIFGGVLVTDRTVIDDGTIALDTPAHDPGWIDVEVVNPDGQSDLLAMAFRYDAPPVPQTATPAYGPTAGDTRVIITGSGFDFTSVVTLDGFTAPSITYVDPQTLSIRTPSHPEGPVVIRVENSDGQAGVLANGFTYSDTIDAGVPDAFVPPPDGAPDAATQPNDPGTSGCVCRASAGAQGGGSGGWLALLGLAALIRSRRGASR